MNRIIDLIEKEQQKTDTSPFKVGDSVRVHTRVVEGDKERIQIFQGIVIGRKGRGLNETFTVRRISYGEGVERVFPSTRRESPRWRSRKPAQRVAPSSITCATARARKRLPSGSNSLTRKFQS